MKDNMKCPACKGVGYVQDMLATALFATLCFPLLPFVLMMEHNSDAKNKLLKEKCYKCKGKGWTENSGEAA